MKVPNIKNVKIKDIKRRLSRYDIEFDEDDIVEEASFFSSGKVLRTKPEAGEELEKGEHLAIYVSKFTFFPLWVWALLISIIAILIFGIHTYLNPNFPTILARDRDWTKENLVYVSKDASMKNGVNHYETCVTTSENTENCIWKPTMTKSIEVSTTGIFNVFFRAVSNSDERGGISNMKTVKIDNAAPIIEKVDQKISDTAIRVDVVASDEHSGLDKYLYSLDGKEYVENGRAHIFYGLKPNTEYDIYVRVMDKLGNYETVILKKIKTNKAGESVELGVIEQEDEANNEDSIDVPNTNGEDDEKSEEIKEDEYDIPLINLDAVPLTIFVDEEHKLPSYYSFGNDTGIIKCMANGVEVFDTAGLPLGKSEVICTATSKHNKVAVAVKEIEVVPEEGEDEELGGWIRLNLFYPEESTNREWRLAREDEIRTGQNNDAWQPYTGPILVKVEDVKNVYIRYKLDNEMVTIPPAGKLMVDIIPDKYTLEGDEKTAVSILYDVNAERREYRVGGGAWQEYTGEFTVGKNTLIEARAIKNEPIYDNDGNYVSVKIVKNTDSVWISEYIPNGKDPSNYTGSTGGGQSGTINYGGISGGSGAAGSGGGYTVPDVATRPSEYLNGPVITAEPTDEIVEEVDVTITPGKEYAAIYYALGNGSYQRYQGTFKVNKNTLIKAYYISAEGKSSAVSYHHVNNIRVAKLPYISMVASPSNYLSEDVDKVTVNISTDGENLQYSYDDHIYYDYEGPLVIKNSTTIFARARNRDGEHKESMVIRTKTPKPTMEELLVSISVSPEKEEIEGLANQVVVSITYDVDATEKYYRIGLNGEYKKYTGPFVLDKNTTIYALAKAENAQGYATKSVDYLTLGITDPQFIVEPESPSSFKKVKIVYDKNASVAKYRIDDGDFVEYTEELTITDNCTITAFSKNELGDESYASYLITSVVTAPEYTILEKNEYYIISLNYPEHSDPATWDYKWGKDGDWKKYNNHGILLIKPQYADSIKKDGDGFVVEDEHGHKVVFTEDVYFLTIAYSDIGDNLFMRWDTKKPNTPTFILSETEPTLQLVVGINYDKTMVEKKYRVVAPSGYDSGWLDYAGGIKVTENETVIYAKGMNVSEVWSDTGSKKIVNIDDKAPEISVMADFETPTRRLVVQINATDNLKVEQVAWTKGEHAASYFMNNGNFIVNNGTFVVDENGEYTVYAEDAVGNKVVYSFEVSNIDLSAPDITIMNKTNEVLTTEVEIEVDYGDSKTRQIKIGENGTYKNYTDVVKISAYDVVGLKNSDNTLTIYAKGIDTAGNESEAKQIIYNLDLDFPATPIISQSTGYPIIYEYGIKTDDISTVAYDKRNDIVNYISMNGTDWKVYTGGEHITAGTVYAKSVKKVSGLTVSTSQAVSSPSDAVNHTAYDGDNNTGQYHGAYVMSKMFVDESMYGNKIHFYLQMTQFSSWGSPGYAHFYDIENNVLSSCSFPTAKWFDGSCTVPTGAHYFRIGSQNSSTYMSLREIRVVKVPIISETRHNAVITKDGITVGYVDTTIKYFQTAREKYYRINGGDWKTYKGNIRLELGDVLEAKSIDKNGEESEIGSYTAVLPSDAIKVAAYDGSTSTGAVYDGQGKWSIDIDKSAWNKRLSVSIRMRQYSSWGSPGYLRFYNEAGELIHTYSFPAAKSTSGYYVIPEGAVVGRFSVENSYTYMDVWEISVVKDPIIRVEEFYPVLSNDKVIPGYAVASIEYYVTTPTRLYKINDGPWQNYTEPVRVELGDTIYAKGVETTGSESGVVSYLSKLPSDAIGSAAYDDSESTSVYYGSISSYMMKVDKAAYGMEVDAYVQMTQFSSWGSPGYMRFYNADNTLIQTYLFAAAKTTRTKCLVPEGAAYLKMSVENTYTYMTIYNLRPVL